MRPLCDDTRRIFAPLHFCENDVVSISSQENGKFTVDCYQLRESYEASRISDATVAQALANGLPDPRAAFPKTRVSCSVAQSFFNRFPESKQLISDRTRYYPHEIPATDTAVEIIHQVVPRENIVFEDAYAAIKFQSVLAISAKYDQLSEMIADFKLASLVPEHDLELCGEAPLSGYQQLAAVCVDEAPGFGLFMEQGTGKTPVIIANICNGAKQHYEKWLAGYEAAEDKSEYPAYQMYRAIIVMPNNLRLNWEYEFSHFSTQAGRLTVLRGNQIDRVKQLVDVLTPDETGELRFTAVICGYQTLYRSWESIKYIPWDFAALDEAQAIKNPKSKQGKTCLELRDRTKKRAVMTGTPIGNSLLDLYMLLEFINEGGSGFSSFEAFREFFGEFDRTASGHDVLVGTKNVPILQERLARMSYFISKKEALPDLPEKIYDVVEVEMGEHQAEIYKQVATQLAIEIEQVEESDLSRTMQVTCILAKLLRLAQITSGFVTWQPVVDIETGEELQPKIFEYFPTNPKIEATTDILLQQGPNSKSIVWAKWIADIEYLQHACEHYGIECVVFNGDCTDEQRKEAVRRFNEDRSCKVFIATAESGGAGLNLLGYPPGAGDDYDTNCDLEIFFSQGWSRITRAQAEDRANRRGTRVVTRIVDIMVPRTIDEEIRRRVQAKNEHSMEVSDLKNILNAIRG